MAIINDDWLFNITKVTKKRMVHLMVSEMVGGPKLMNTSNTTTLLQAPSQLNPQSSPGALVILYLS